MAKGSGPGKLHLPVVVQAKCHQDIRRDIVFVLKVEMASVKLFAKSVQTATTAQVSK